MKLDNFEEMLTRQELVYKWLTENKISFYDLSVAYVKSLEKERKDNRVTINSMAVPLASMFNSNDRKSQRMFFKLKAAFNLIKARVYYGTPFEKELKDLVKKYKYSEDEKGFHTVDNEKLKLLQVREIK